MKAEVFKSKAQHERGRQNAVLGISSGRKKHASLVLKSVGSQSGLFGASRSEADTYPDTHKAQIVHREECFTWNIFKQDLASPRDFLAKVLYHRLTSASARMLACIHTVMLACLRTHPEKHTHIHIRHSTRAFVYTTARAHTGHHD